MIKIAVLYICIGKYDVFWEKFYKSSQKYFLTDDEKTYFVFTDKKDIYSGNDKCVRIILQENLGWPGNTLFRFKMFMRIIDELKNFDYIFFINANTVFLKEIGNEILPKNRLLVIEHAGNFRQDMKKIAYDRNPNSLAYVEPNRGEVYVYGGYNGGSAFEYIEMIKTLAYNIDYDYAKGIIAKWHDESHFNHYILEHSYQILDTSYAYPEGWILPLSKRVLMLDKSRVASVDSLRNIYSKCYIDISDNRDIRRLMKERVVIWGIGDFLISFEKLLNDNRLYFDVVYITDTNVDNWKQYIVFQEKQYIVVSLGELIANANDFDAIIIVFRLGDIRNQLDGIPELRSKRRYYAKNINDFLLLDDRR